MLEEPLICGFLLFIANRVYIMTISENEIRSMLMEELSKQEVKSMIDSKVAEYLKDREFKKRVRDITVDVLDDFFHEMWRKNGFWKNPIKNR